MLSMNVNSARDLSIVDDATRLLLVRLRIIRQKLLF
jgi:hypothetical protein